MTVERSTRRLLVLTLTVGCLALYVGLTIGFDLGNPFRIFGVKQLRAFIPSLLLFVLAGDLLRLVHVKREEGGEKKVGGESRSRGEEKVGRESRSRADVHSSTSTPNFNSSAPLTALEYYRLQGARAGGTADELWERARVMPHNVIPDVMEDAGYLELVHAAADAGHVAALAKLGDYAFRRQAYVEAYFWTKMAHRRLELSDPTATEGLKEIEGMLRNIRRQWSAAGQPLEEENVYNHFSLARGELGRAFLGLDGGYEVRQARDYLQLLAEKGNADAALFIEK